MKITNVVELVHPYLFFYSIFSTVLFNSNLLNERFNIIAVYVTNLTLILKYGIVNGYLYGFYDHFLLLKFRIFGHDDFCLGLPGWEDHRV